MIQFVEGDILLSTADAIAHGVAPNDHFDQGLALALRERWPSMAKDFRHWAHVNHPKPGEAWTWSGAGGVRIVNLLTQDGRIERGARPEKATTHNVNDALKSLGKVIEQEGFKAVALPRLACGVGGLDWNEDVKPLFTRHFSDSECKVYVYEVYHAGQKANET